MSEHDEETEERSENERWYDEVLAPRLSEIVLECKARNLSCLAIVAEKDGFVAQTIHVEQADSFRMAFINGAIKNAPNLDGFYIGFMRYCRNNGINTSGSIIARLVDPEKMGKEKPQ